MSTKECKVKESTTKERKSRRTMKTEKSETQSGAEHNMSPMWSTDGQSSKGCDIFYYEENAVEEHSPEQDLALHKAASDELRHVMMEINKLKSSDDPDKQKKIEELCVHGTLQFVNLRKLNRMAHFRCKKSRDKTNQAKKAIDQQHLRLQNLLYEVMHLQKEITKCLEFKSKDEEINLVPVDEFYKEAPKSISRPDATLEDLHQQTLARLEWELEQRKRLSEMLKEAQGNKDVIVNETKAKQEYLESLQPKLNSILQATKPVQDYLEMPFDEIREQQTIAMYLPQPLYVLYMQASAYKDACDKNMNVSISGDIDVAKAMESTSIEIEEESDSDNEDLEKPKEIRCRRNTTSDKTEEKKQKILKKHPLSVQLLIKCKDESTLQLSFFYLVVLKIVTVTVKLTPGGSSVGASAVCTGDLLSPDSLLCCLYPEDMGNDTPNKSNNYVLKKIGLDEFSKYISEVGRPYHWAQWLCGLQFLKMSEHLTRPQLSLSQGHMEGTIKRLRRRIRARISLHQQLSLLERGQVPVLVEYTHLTPAKISSRLVSWKRSTFDDFSALPYTQELINTGLANETDMYFLGMMERGSAKMLLQVIIGQDYPNVAPLFALSLQWQHERTNLNEENIREMEAEVNVFHSELVTRKSQDQLLTNQIQRLLMCLDVYVESDVTTDVQEGPVEFSREKMFPRVSRGPNRAKPFKYNPQMGFFSHR